MSSTTKSPVYARLSDDKQHVLEYPVSGQDIINRAHPLNWYTEVAFETVPPVPRFHTLTETLQVLGFVVLAKYTISENPLFSLLADIYDRKNVDTTDDWQRVNASYEDIDAETFAQLQKLFKEHVQKKLDTFAQTNGYDNMQSVCSYFGSTNLVHNKDAITALHLRDQTWLAVFGYYNDVVAGKVKLPKTVEEAEAILPELIWE